MLTVIIDPATDLPEGGHCACDACLDAYEDLCRAAVAYLDLGEPVELIRGTYGSRLDRSLHCYETERAYTLITDWVSWGAHRRPDDCDGEPARGVLYWTPALPRCWVARCDDGRYVRWTSVADGWAHRSEYKGHRSALRPARGGVTLARAMRLAGAAAGVKIDCRPCQIPPI